MSEARMAQQMGAIRGEFKHPAVTINANASVVPCATGSEVIPVTLTSFKDHGRPAFVASTINSRRVLQQVAGNLDKYQSKRLTGALVRTMEDVLDKGIVRSDGVMKSDIQGKPDIHIVTLGDPYKDSSLRLYFHLGEHRIFGGDGRPVRATVIFQDARATKKEAERVERLFREGGYSPQWGWDNGRRS